ncbi:PREDICTED: glutamate receptor 2.8-like [Erythranthe guttata]|uniref:glutamate receptor 2.8-like n=1 Tax=Erythranthe guttata TaxID=4155 RepID=UPI00064DA0BA|nr:PREDICTED: glutamate receptor 2.8-like [Erythranthe guttata]|eukprot:XP_012856401.1 PREDICTED: glutamate receptor 2.8-like [Erythranthe guttata]
MSIVFAHREKIVSNLARVVVVVWIFVVLVLTSTYTASLSARLTILKLQQGDTDVNTLIRNGDYVGCREGTFLAGFLKIVGFDESKIRIYKGAKELEVSLSKGSDKGGITAMFSGSPYADVFLSKYCNKYRKVGSPYLTEGIAFGF